MVDAGADHGVDLVAIVIDVKRAETNKSLPYLCHTVCTAKEKNNFPNKEISMKKILLLTVLFTLILSGCGRKDEAPNPPAELQVSDPARQLEAAAGKEFKIILDSNPTTGYHWEVIGELDESVVTFVSKNYKADGLQLTGSGGLDVWVFKAEAPGETIIALGYYPPGASTEAEQTITFNVVVK